LRSTSLRRKWSLTISNAADQTKQQHFAISRPVSPRGGFLFHLRLFEFARALVCFDHIASLIENANQSVHNSSCQVGQIFQNSAHHENENFTHKKFN